MTVEKATSTDLDLWSPDILSDTCPREREREREGEKEGR
jgi:hypothetical protein